MPVPTLRDILPPSPEKLQQDIIGDNQLYRGFTTGIKGITSGSLANDALNAELRGAQNADAMRREALASQQEAAAYAPRVGSLRDIGGAGDAFDYAAGALGQGVASMAPSLAAAALARIPGAGAGLSRLSSYAGAAGAGYLQEKGEAVLGQYSDPVLAATSAQDRSRAATTKAVINAALEGIVPAGLTRMAGKNGLGRILAKDAVTEGATEAAQQYVGHLANKSLDPNRQLDPWDIADAFVGGALTGGTVGAVHGLVHTPKDFVGRTTDSIIEAGKNAPTPQDFLKAVFKGNPTVKNDPVAAGDMHSSMIDAVSAAGDKAAEVLDSMTAKRNELATKYAEEILNDPNTPAAVRQQVVDMQGKYDDPNNQVFLGTQYVGRRAGEAAGAASDFIKGMSDRAAKIKGMADRVVKKNLQITPLTPDEEFALHKDIIDSLTPDAKRRTDIIKDIPLIAKGVSGIINKMAIAKPTDENIRELQQLYSAASSLFADPETTLTKLAQKIEGDRAAKGKRTPFSDLLAGVTTAQQDVKKNDGNSYLRARLVAPMTDEQIGMLAQFVDEFGMTDMKSNKQADKVLDGLAVAFGGRAEALQVLDYYSQANRLNAKQLTQYEENNQFEDEEGNVRGMDNGLTEQELVPTKTYSFADQKSNRPFLKGEGVAKLDAKSLREGKLASDSAKVSTIPYSQYVEETGKDARGEVKRIMNDVKSRYESALLGYADELGVKGDKAAKLEMANRFAAEQRPSPNPKSTRLASINKLQNELDVAREAFKQGGDKAVLDRYEVNSAEQNEKDDLTATDEDIKAMATNKYDEDMVAFTKADGSKMVLSASSMMLTQAAKEKRRGQAARGEGGSVREKRLMKEAIASVLAREDIKGMDEKTTPPTLKRFPRSDDTKAALKEQEGSVNELKKRMDEVVKDYEDGGYEAEERERTRIANANDKIAEKITDPNEKTKFELIAKIDLDAVSGTGRELIRTSLERNIARLQSQYEAAAGSAPRRAVIRQRQAVYKEALASMDAIYAEEQRDLHADEGVLDTTKIENAEGPRVYQEETGEQLAAYGDLKKPTRSEDRVFKKSLQGVGIPSDKLIDAVYDVVHNENYSRLDTPEKALAFARAAKQVLEHLNKMSYTDREAKYGEDRSDELVGLRNSLEEMFNQSGYISFDWNSLVSEVDGSEADIKEMERIVKSSKQDKAGRTPGAQTFDQISRDEVIAEIARIRGKDVAVAFATFADIGGSGDFSMNRDKSERLIRIAVDAANMKSVAWHESLHDFIAMLGGTPEERKIKRDMLQATNTPAINARLRELLKDHPEARKQLDDPEERLAYVYQFWAEGVLELTPKADTIMGKVATFIRTLLGIVSSEGKLEAQFAALHRGEMTEPSTVAKVIADLDAQTIADKLQQLAGPLADGLSRVFTSATERLREHGIEELDQLADLFHRDPGHEKGQTGMLQRRAQKEGQFNNALQSILEGTTAAQRKAALKNMQDMKPPSSELETKLKDLLKTMYNYMVDAGVQTYDGKNKEWKDVGYVDNYFPRNWDGDAIRRDEAKFKALLQANNVSPEQVKAIYNTLVFGGSLDMGETDKSLGFIPQAVHIQDRLLTFIDKSNAHLFSEFQNQDLMDIMTTYIRQASHRAEYARSFGNKGEVIQALLKSARANGLTKEEEESLLPTIRGLEGTLGHDMNPAMKHIMGGIMTMENVLLMPMAIFSQFIDPLNIAMRTSNVKDAGHAYLQALKDLKRFVTRDKSTDTARELAKMLGIISTDNMLEAMGQTQVSMYMTKTMRDINRQFFRYNGMEGWNNSMRIAATVAGERYLLDNRSNERALEELGVDAKYIMETTSNALVPNGTKASNVGRMAITKQQFEGLGLSADEAQKAAEQIQEAMFRFVDGAVVRPNAAHRATWMSDPRFQLVSHLKQFTYSFQAAVLARAKNEYLRGNAVPITLLAASVPVMFAADMAKWLLTGTTPKNWTFFDYFTHAVTRSGALGKYEYAAKTVEDAARGHMPGISFAGPTAEHATLLAQWIAGAPGASTDKLISRTIPLARYA